MITMKRWEIFMSTKFVSKARKASGVGPGARSLKARKVAKWVLLAFAGACAIAIVLQLAEISTPGMAWYTYE